MVGQPQDISRLLEAEEAWEKQWEVQRQERAAERKEWDARGQELQVMSDAVAQLWERFRTSMTTAPAPRAISSSVPLPLLVVGNTPDELRPKSLSPADILARHYEHTHAAEAEPSQPDATVPIVEHADSPSRHVEERVDDFLLGDNSNLDVQHEHTSGMPVENNPGDVDFVSIMDNVDLAVVPGSSAIQGLVKIVNAVF